MKYSICFSLLMLILNMGNSQSLSSDRISKIKNATVRITIENINSVGTGFFIDKKGDVLTCWHVINQALVINNGQVTARRIYAELRNGNRIELVIPDVFVKNANLNENAVAYDFCLLVPKNSNAGTDDYLKLGEYTNVQEGDEIYTCGYPIGIEQQFVSRGIISTKFVDTSIILVNSQRIKIPRSQALLDLTLNRGNSGGAIVRVGKTINDDEVIGIADFIITPIGGIADSLINTFDNATKYGTVEISGVDPNKTFSLMTKLISSLSIGVSGCVSIDYFVQSMTSKK